MGNKVAVMLLLLVLPLSIAGASFNGVALGGGLSCDEDSDGDGIPDCTDPCPYDSLNKCIYIPWIEWEWDTPLLENGAIQATPGQLIPIDLLIIKAPTGLEMYKFHFQIGDSFGEGQIAAIKRVESIAIDQEFCRSVTSPPPEWQGFWINFSCRDRKNQVRSLARNLHLARIELEVQELGDTYLGFQIDALDDDHLPVANRIRPPFSLKLQVIE
jgi:hypothetical protein